MVDRVPYIPDAVLRAYGLDPAVRASELESYGNQNWLVEEARVRFVLKRHALNSDPARIAFQVEFQQRLRKQGISTPQVITASNGDQVTMDHAGVPWMLYEYVDGDEYRFDRREHLVEAARLLARIHLATADLRIAAPGPEYKASIQECWENAASDVEELRHMLHGRGLDDGLDDLAAWWSVVLEEWPAERVAVLPGGWMHGDYHGRNLVYRGDRIAAVLDFDDVDRGPYVHDVTMGAFKFGRPGRGTIDLREDAARAFIAAYEEVRPLNAEERSAVPMMIVMGYPPHPRNYYYRQDLGEDISQRFRDEMATIASLRTHVAKMGALA